MSYIKDIRIQDSSPVISLTFPSSNSVNLNPRIPGNPKAAASGLDSVHVALSERLEATLHH